MSIRRLSGRRDAHSRVGRVSGPAIIVSPRALIAVRAALADSEPLVRTRAVAALINLEGESELALLRAGRR